MGSLRDIRKKRTEEEVVLEAISLPKRNGEYEFTVPFYSNGYVCPYLDGEEEESIEIGPYVRRGESGKFYVTGIIASDGEQAAQRAWVLVRKFLPGQTFRGKWLLKAE
jgi:hypothetical protein